MADERNPSPAHPAEPGASGNPSPAHPAEPGASGNPSPAHPAEPGASGIGLHSLMPAPGSRKDRKRIGRGEGSGTGKTSGRGHKGAGARSGSRKRVRFEGGQTPIHMRMRKLPGPHMKKSMPFEKFRTKTQPVNLRDLEARFDQGAEVTPDALRGNGLATRRAVPVKILGQGELTKPLTVHAHGFSKTAREKIESAGGTCLTIED